MLADDEVLLDDLAAEDERKSFGFHGCEVKKTIFSDVINDIAIRR